MLIRYTIDDSPPLVVRCGEDAQTGSDVISAIEADNLSAPAAAFTFALDGHGPLQREHLLRPASGTLMVRLSKRRRIESSIETPPAPLTFVSHGTDPDETTFELQQRGVSPFDSSRLRADSSPFVRASPIVRALGGDCTMSPLVPVALTSPVLGTIANSDLAEVRDCNCLSLQASIDDENESEVRQDLRGGVAKNNNGIFTS